MGRPRRRRFAQRPPIPTPPERPPHLPTERRSKVGNTSTTAGQKSPLRGPSWRRVLTSRGKALRAETTEVTPQHRHPSHLVVSLWRVCHTSQDLALRFSETPPRLHGHTPTVASGGPHCPRLPTEPLACCAVGRSRCVPTTTTPTTQRDGPTPSQQASH